MSDKSPELKNEDELLWLEQAARNLSPDEPRRLLDRRPARATISVITFLGILGVFKSPGQWSPVGIAALGLLLCGAVMSWVKDEGRKPDDE